MSITTKLYGRIGNQMFMIANTIAYALRFGHEYRIPAHTLDEEKWPTYFTHFPKLDQNFIHFGIQREVNHGYNEIPKREQICFDGYFQSYKYFWDYKEQIIESFQPAFHALDVQLPDFKGKSSIHVRRGDYVDLETKHPTINISYLQKATAYLKARRINNFSVFSDDIEWCKENITPVQFPDCNFRFISSDTGDSKKDAIMDLYYMSKHDHQIIANSTYSYWAALLNKNPYKMIVSPSTDNWFGEDNKDLDIKDLLPPDWIQIKY